MRIAFWSILILASLAYNPSPAQDSTSAVGELSLAVGPSLPRSGFLSGDNPGLNVGLKLNGRLRRFQSLSVWVGVNGNFFRADEFLVPVDDDGYTYLGVEKVGKYYISGHLGLQLGCRDQTRFFRPHIGLAPGLYLAMNSNRISIVETGREFLGEDRLQARLAARAVVGADFYPSPRWGFSLDFFQDWAFDVDKPMRYDATRGFISESATARFYSLMLGFVLPFETLRGLSRD